MQIIKDNQSYSNATSSTSNNTYNLKWRSKRRKKSKLCFKKLRLLISNAILALTSILLINWSVILLLLTGLLILHHRRTVTARINSHNNIHNNNSTKNFFNKIISDDYMLVLVFSIFKCKFKCILYSSARLLDNATLTIRQCKTLFLIFFFFPYVFLSSSTLAQQVTSNDSNNATSHKQIFDDEELGVENSTASINTGTSNTNQLNNETESSELKCQQYTVDFDMRMFKELNMHATLLGKI